MSFGSSVKFVEASFWGYFTFSPLPDHLVGCLGELPQGGFQLRRLLQRFITIKVLHNGLPIGIAHSGYKLGISLVGELTVFMFDTPHIGSIPSIYLLPCHQNQESRVKGSSTGKCNQLNVVVRSFIPQLLGNYMSL